MATSFFNLVSFVCPTSPEIWKKLGKKAGGSIDKLHRQRSTKSSRIWSSDWETMTVNKSFLLLYILITSGFLLCTSLLIKQELNRRIKEDRVMGVDLGATYSSVGVYKHPSVERGYCKPREWQCAALSFSDIIEIVGTMPSCVAFTDSGVLFGEQAKAQGVANPQTTICGITRLLGRRFDDAEVQRYIKVLTYKVVNQENKPYVEVKLKNGDTKLYSPKQICAMILGRLKEMAEKYMGNEVELTVILLQQGYFDNEVRGDIEEACDLAGLKNTYVRKSTDAVGLASSIVWTRPNLKALVYDLGGSAFGATIVEHYEGAYEVTAAKGDIHLGGQAFDTRLVDYFVNLIKRKYNKDISNDLTALVMLRTVCEKAKITLSSSERFTVMVDFPLDGNDTLHFDELLTREMFEELNMDLFYKTIQLVKGALEEGQLKKTDLDEIILVGASTQIPMIRHLLNNFFRREPFNVRNPVKALAFAATHIAGLFIGRNFVGEGQWVQNTLSVGIETIGGVMTPFVKHDTYVPATKSRNVTTYHDGQTTIEIRVFEGETLFTKYCHYLGSIRMSNLPPVQRGVTTIEVTLEVYKDWNIRVTVEHKATRKKKSMTILYKERYNSMEELRQAYSNIHKCYDEDKTLKDIFNKFQPQANNMTIAISDKIDWKAQKVLF